MSRVGQGTKFAVEYCRKFQPPEYGAGPLQMKVRQTDRRQTDGRAIAYSEGSVKITRVQIEVSSLLLFC